MRTKVIRAVVILAVLLANVGCDQLSKHVVRQRIDAYEQIEVVTNHLTLMRVENKGAFLSLGAELPKAIRFTLLSVFPLVVLGFGLGYLFTKTNLPKLSVVGFSFVIGGGIGNLYDRLVHGSVTDFLHIDFIIFETGVFNMADVSIMTGMALVLLGSFIHKNKPVATDPVS